MVFVSTEIRELNARRLLCPIPVIRTQNVIKEMQVGEQLRIFATDPGVMHDIPAWCRIHGHAVLSAEKVENEFHLLVQK